MKCHWTFLGKLVMYSVQQNPVINPTIHIFQKMVAFNCREQVVLQPTEIIVVALEKQSEYMRVAGL